jgi:hypothetical protein
MFTSLNLKVRQSLNWIFPPQVDALAHERLRLRILFGVAMLKMFNFIGGAWDIQWHVEIGRDSLWIPPHLLVLFSFTTGVLLTLALIIYETKLAASGVDLPFTARFGPLRAPGAVFGIFFGYVAALLSGAFDEFWHQVFGIDATLWSPPHLMIMVAIMVVDFSLILGIAASSLRQGYKLKWNSPFFLGLVLTGAYAFEAVNFQMGEAFIVGYRNDGAGLYGLLFPILVGGFLPLSMMVCIRLSQRFWIGLPVMALTLALQYAATGISALGFAILKPVSVIDEYVLANPSSTAAMSRKFAALLGQNGLIGLHQAWTMSLFFLPLVVVALLGFIPAARRRPLLAAPLFAVSMVGFSYMWFQQMPALQEYAITNLDVLLAAGIAAVISLITGSLGLRLAEKVDVS